MTEIRIINIDDRTQLEIVNTKNKLFDYVLYRGRLLKRTTEFGGLNDYIEVSYLEIY